VQVLTDSDFVILNGRSTDCFTKVGGSRRALIDEGTLLLLIWHCHATQK
jgi:hypothetical protein